MDTVVLLISFLMQGFANDCGRDLCKANTAPGSLGKGEKLKLVLLGGHYNCTL